MKKILRGIQIIAGLLIVGVLALSYFNNDLSGEALLDKVFMESFAMEGTEDFDFDKLIGEEITNGRIEMVLETTMDGETVGAEIDYSMNGEYSEFNVSMDVEGLRLSFPGYARIVSSEEYEAYFKIPMDTIWYGFDETSVESIFETLDMSMDDLLAELELEMDADDETESELIIEQVMETKNVDVKGINTTEVKFKVTDEVDPDFEYYMTINFDEDYILNRIYLEMEQDEDTISIEATIYDVGEVEEITIPTSITNSYVDLEELLMDYLMMDSDSLLDDTSYYDIDSMYNF